MAMIIEREGIDLSAVYRPLNNKFLNLIMENLRKNIFVKIKLKKVLKVLERRLLILKKVKV